MKKAFYIILALLSTLGFGSCNEISMFEEPEFNSTSNEISGIRSASEALILALQTDEDIHATISRAPHRMANPLNVFPLSERNNARSESDTILYIVEYDNNQGFAVISANREAEPVLAVVDNGNYAEAAESGNEGFNIFMDLAAAYAKSPKISVTDTNTIVKPWIKADEYREERTVLNHRIVEPRTLSLEWGQRAPEGWKCPNKVSGCGPTAMLLALSTLKSPQSITLTYESPSKEVEINWDAITSHKKSISAPWDDIYDGCNSDVHDEISILCRELGHRANARYNVGATQNENSTSVYNDDVKNALAGIPGLLVGDWKSYSLGSVRAGISSGAVLISAHRGSYQNGSFQSDGVGHMWFADGFIFKKEQIDVYTKKADDIVWSFVESYTHTTESIHFNWGWNGKCNGYFVTDVFRVQPGGENEIYAKAQYLTIKTSE